ncbi:MAG: hypothetical protein KAT68_10730 [Bacteroidales bacterium]|nr:hypothetical protein [Bacteroidales bacterium]
MKALKDYFKDEDIIFYLCRIRAKYAKQRNKKHLIHLLTKNESFNYHKVDIEKKSVYEKKFQTDLNKLFPSRRKWKDLGEKSRYKKNSKQKLRSIDKNIYSLLKTIKFYRKNKPYEKFVIELNSFIKDIQQSIENSEYFISKPTIYPKLKDRKSKFELKEDEKNICRPIALFSLKDRLILSLTNKFLTQLFDSYFDNCSLAFRYVKKVDEKKIIVNHHNAIQEIIKYKGQHKETPLWVAECDMKKFYDSVNHKIIIKLFDRLLKKAKYDNPNLDLSAPERIFYKYLDCYSFNNNVSPLNDYTLNRDYWDNYNIPKGEFGWVQNDFKALKYYYGLKFIDSKPNFIEKMKTKILSLIDRIPIIYNERIGIPQGGALSGLISNIVLDYADRKLIENDLFYVRFCDDMILMHPDKDKCDSKVKDYKKGLEELLLVPHGFCKEQDLISKRKKQNEKLPVMTLAPFWKEKSKGPYKWDKVNNGGFPWVGFVGYELHFNGFIRVRKNSLEKELNKQKEVVNQIRNAIKTDKRVSNGTITESAIHRLIGMSIGRIDLWNCSEIENEMCWKNGFQELNNNKYSVKQLKELDRTRNRLYYKLISDLGKLEEEEKEIIGKPSNRQIFSYNKPFSYYYQVAERPKT